jgi:hypothetical protein
VDSAGNLRLKIAHYLSATVAPGIFLLIDLNGKRFGTARLLKRALMKSRRVRRSSVRMRGSIRALGGEGPCRFNQSGDVTAD